MGVWRIPLAGQFGLGEAPDVGLFGETPVAGGSIMMLAMQPCPGSLVCHGQSLSQTVSLVLSIVLDCLGFCP